MQDWHILQRYLKWSSQQNSLRGFFQIIIATTFLKTFE